MTEQFQNPNQQPEQPQDMDFGQIDPSLQVPQAAIDAEIARSTQPLQEYMKQEDIGGENRRIAGERILQIAGIVQDNPERVAADISKSPDKRTEHDPERAHLMALATDGNMTKLAVQDNRLAAGKNLMPWQKTSRASNLLGARMGENLAEDVYNDDPVEAGPNMVAWRKTMAVETGHKSYKTIKSAKLPH